MNIVLLVVLGLFGTALGLTGYLGLRGKLARNRFFGVRTSASMRDDETFLLANRVAGLPNLVAGGIAVASGVAAFLASETSNTTSNTTVTVGLVGALGAVATAIAGGVLGHRAAAAVPEPVAPKGCGGCACGGGCGPLARL